MVLVELLTRMPPERVARPATDAVPVAVMFETLESAPLKYASPCTAKVVAGEVVPTPKVPYKSEFPVTCNVEEANNPPLAFVKNKFEPDAF